MFISIQHYNILDVYNLLKVIRFLCTEGSTCAVLVNI